MLLSLFWCVYISESAASPPTAAVLIVFDDLDQETVLSAARWLVENKEKEPGGAGLRSALSCIYSWLFAWNGTPALGRWILAYIKALEVIFFTQVYKFTTLPFVDSAELRACDKSACRCPVWRVR